MVSLASLWLPIVLAGVGVFFVSCLVHMVLQIHKSDYHQLPREAEILEQLRREPLPPAIYMFPFHTGKDWKSPEVKAKFDKGPVGMLAVRKSGMPSMLDFLGLWFGYCLLVCFFTAYIAAHTVPAGAHYLAVFRVVGACAFMAFGLNELVGSIWRGQPWGVTFKHVFDGLLYSLVAAGFFGWLWPR